jgi:hypothetical protein
MVFGEEKCHIPVETPLVLLLWPWNIPGGLSRDWPHTACIECKALVTNMLGDVAHSKSATMRLTRFDSRRVTLTWVWIVVVFYSPCSQSTRLKLKIDHDHFPAVSAVSTPIVILPYQIVHYRTSAVVLVLLNARIGTVPLRAEVSHS